MMLSVFGDESADERQERVFSVSGLHGSASEWNRAIEGWIKLTKEEEFHAADWERAGRYREVIDLAEFVGSCGLIAGFSVSLDLIAFCEVFPENLRDSGYYQCFSKVLQIHSDNARQWNERVSANPNCGDPLITLEFTFDHRQASEGNAGTLYSAFINQPEWKDANILSSKVSFDCRSNPRIQMADLVAREAFRELDRRVSSPHKKRREPFLALERHGAFKFIELDRKYCIELRGLVQASGDEPQYWEWLRNTGRVQHGKPMDNYGNRFSFYTYLINKEALEKSGKKQGVPGVRPDNDNNSSSRPKSGEGCDGSGEEG